jgi:hypothetical protein
MHGNAILSTSFFKKLLAILYFACPRLFYLTMDYQHVCMSI